MALSRAKDAIQDLGDRTGLRLPPPLLQKIGLGCTDDGRYFHNASTMGALYGDEANSELTFAEEVELRNLINEANDGNGVNALPAYDMLHDTGMAGASIVTNNPDVLAGTGQVVDVLAGM